MAPTRDPKGTDEWADAVSGSPAGTDSDLLPAVRGERALVSLRDTSARIPLPELVLGIVDATLTTLRRSVGIPTAQRSTMVDMAFEITWRGWSLANRGLATAEQVTAPAMRLVTDPPFLPRSLRPSSFASEAAASWRARRDDVQQSANDVKNVVVTSSVDMAMGSLDLTELVLTQVDLRDIVEAVLTELDLTQVVLDNVDLGRVIDAALDTVDLDKIARERMDLLELADYIIDGIDLPNIIRESTGSVASETIQSVRMQSIDADVAVQRIVDRFLLRRRQRQAASSSPSDEDETL
jgi:hypothetical protein